MEKNKIKYQDILDNILDREFSTKCICPTQYMRSTRQNKKECMFGPDCQFSNAFGYEQSKCTCIPKSTRSLVSERTPQKEKDCICTCDCISDLDDQDCTCTGICNCNSNEIIIMKPPSRCNKNICRCVSCLCQTIYSPPNLLPSCFRNAVKKDHYNQTSKSKLICDNTIKQEIEEIIQLVKDHQQIKEKFGQTNIDATSVPSINEGSKILLPKPEIEKQDPVTKLDKDLIGKPGETYNNTDTKEATLSPECIQSTKPNKKIPTQPIVKPETTVSPESVSSTKPNKINPAKKKRVKPTCTKETLRIPVVKKTTHKSMRIRYYYSGSTDHYGVKLGHRHCLGSSVPCNNTWEWKPQENTTYNRERGPPGHIGKSVKNMMKVMKNAGKNKNSKHSLTKKLSDGRFGKSEDSECEEDPPLIHVHKKGRTYNITFCPKESDPDIKPVPIPFAFTKKKQGSDSDSTESSTLEIELHSPVPHNILNGKETKSKQKKTNMSPSEVYTTKAHMTIPSNCPIPTELTNDNRFKKKEKEKILRYKSETNLDPTISEAFNDKKLKKKVKMSKLRSTISIGPNDDADLPNKKSKIKEKNNRIKSVGSQENKILWEEHQTQMQNIPNKL